MARWKNMSKRLAVLIMMGAMMLGSATTGRLYDRIGKKAYAKVVYVMPTGVICKVSNRDLEKG